MTSPKPSVETNSNSFAVSSALNLAHSGLPFQWEQLSDRETEKAVKRQKKSHNAPF